MEIKKIGTKIVRVEISRYNKETIWKNNVKW